MDTCTDTTKELSQGTMGGKRRRGGQERCGWITSSVDDLLTSTQDRTRWRKAVAEACVCVTQ